MGGPSCLDQDRQRPGRVEQQKFLPPLPDALLDEFRRDLAFGENEADEAGGDGEGVVENLDHAFSQLTGRIGVEERKVLRRCKKSVDSGRGSEA